MSKQSSLKDLQQALDSVTQYGSAYKAGPIIGVNRNTLKDRYLSAIHKGMTPSKGVVPYEPCGSSTLTGPNGEVKLRWEKRSEKQGQFQDALIALAEELGQSLPKAQPVKVNKKKFLKEVISVCPWGDPHFGLLCHHEEVGEDFDTDIAERDLIAAVKYLITQSPSSERMIIANMGDFYHADNNRAETYAGTRLDVDSRLHRVLRIGVRAIRTCIAEALKRHKIVEFVTVQGNHDETLAMCLALLLESIYEKEPRVIIHSQPTRRKYIQHGKVMLGFVHGDKQRPDKLPLIAATEKSEIWGATKHRVFFKGHLHHDHIQEFNGMKVEMVRTLAPNDEYAVSGGWLSKSDMKLITYHKEYGEVARSTCSIDMLRGLG